MCAPGDGAREIEIRIHGAQHGDLRGGFIFGDDDRRSLRRVERGAVLAIDQKSEVALLRFFDARDISNFGLGVAIHRAAELFRYFRKFHRAHLVILCFVNVQHARRSVLAEAPLLG